MKISLAPLVLVFFSASSVAEQNLATPNPYAPTDEYNVPLGAESYCTPDNEPQSGDSCDSDREGLVCAFRNTVQCTCGGSTWSCGALLPLPTPPTAPPTTPPPTCNPKDPVDCSGEAYFIDVTKDNNDMDVDEDLDVVAETESGAESSAITAVTAYMVLAAAAGAAALVV